MRTNKLEHLRAGLIAAAIDWVTPDLDGNKTLNQNLAELVADGQLDLLENWKMYLDWSEDGGVISVSAELYDDVFFKRDVVDLIKEFSRDYEKDDCIETLSALKKVVDEQLEHHKAVAVPRKS